MFAFTFFSKDQLGIFVRECSEYADRSCRILDSRNELFIAKCTGKCDFCVQGHLDEEKRDWVVDQAWPDYCFFPTCLVADVSTPISLAIGYCSQL
jgi:hypothetical protein